MKKILLILALTVFQNSFSQKSTEITYSNGELYMVKQDVNTYKVISEQPYAKVKSVVYDTFYKSYVFILSTPEMETTGFSLSYVSFDKEHNLIHMKDAQDDNWTAVDNLSTNGTLFLTNEVANNGIILSLKFKHLVKD